MEHGRARVLAGEQLDAATIAAVEVILQGDASPAQIAGFLVALRGRGETSSELSAMLDVMLAHGVEVPLNESQRSLAIDVVEPVATDRTRSTCRRWLHSRCRCRRSCVNTAIDRPHHRAEPPMCSKRSASTLALLPTPWLDVFLSWMDSALHNISSSLSFRWPASARIGIPTAFNLLPAQWPTGSSAAAGDRGC